MSKTGVIGFPRRRVDGRAMTTGQTKYADDVVLPRMVFAKLLRSPVPHARIASVDTARAAAHPGVLLVLTGRDLPIPYGILPVTQDEHALAIDKVRFVGDPVALVVARDEATATEALDLIDVEYEPLKTIADYDDALATNEPRIHDYGAEGNVHKKVALQFGDVDEGFAEADQIFEDTFFYEGNTHLPLEQHATVAYLDGGGKLVVMSSTQTPHYVHRALAKALEVPAAHIRVIATPNGGGFGGKSDPFNHEVAAAKAALILDRPVKITLTREEVFYCHRGRHPVMMKFRTGVKNDGTLTAVHLQTILDGGSYGSYGVASTFYTGALQTVTYHVPRYKFQGCRVFTNKAPCGPKRGHGTPQSRFGQEVQIDKIAERLGTDPADFRLRIVEQPNTLTANFLRVSTIGLAECIRRVVGRSDWKQRYRRMGRGRGLGLACSSYLSGAGLPIYWNDMPHSAVQLKLDRSGGVTAFCGSAEIGQGSDDVLVACVAEVLGIQPFDIRAVTGDTDLTPVDLGSYSSRVTLMMGNAAIQAATRARDILADAVERKLAVPKGRLVFADGRVFDTEDPDRGMSFRDAICTAEAMFGSIGTVGSYTPPRSAAKFKGGGVGPSPTYSYTAAVVEVEVDESTGWVVVPRVWIAHDIGRALNPTLVRGQVEGSVYMGLGEALMEEQAYRRLPPRLSHALVHKFPSMLEYKSLTSLDMPEVFTDLVENPDPNGPFGAKEAGQGPLLPIMPAVANAVYDAVGVRIDEVPITPEKIVKALADKAAGKPARYGPSSFPDVSWPDALQVPPPWEGGDGHSTSGFVSKDPAKRNPRSSKADS
jgi:4-hydroxybenzoyl-CoA reductase subunit alpha